MTSSPDLKFLSATERRNTPVIINNFNRFSLLRSLVEHLQQVGLLNIIILDNGSHYEPTLDYYRTVNVRVVLLKRNLGYLAPWENGFIASIPDVPFIYTDPDVLPDEGCPPDYIDRLFDAPIRYPQLDKVGLGLRLDDLPPSLPTTAAIVQHERGFWTRPEGEDLFLAPVDTPFALYRPSRCGGYWLNGARTAPPYLIRHLPWYMDPQQLDEEEKIYRAHVRNFDPLVGHGLSCSELPASGQHAYLASMSHSGSQP